MNLKKKDVLNRIKHLEEAITKGFVPPVPVKARLAIGVLVLMPILPSAAILNIELPVEEAMSKMSLAPARPTTAKRVSGVDVPTPVFPALVTRRKEAAEVEETSSKSEV